MTRPTADAAVPDDADRARLRPDCRNCFALCCTALGFQASPDFAITKPPGQPCPHLLDDFGCGIHDRLLPEGFAGCIAYDCMGAGQRVAQHSYRGRDWRQHPELADGMFVALQVMEELHLLLWYLADAAMVAVDQTTRAAVADLTRTTEALASVDGPDLVRLSIDTHRHTVEATLRLVSAQARARYPGPTADHRGADLTGADLAGADLVGADLSGTTLLRADLHGADLRGADLMGTRLTGADVTGANLAGSVYGTQMQLHLARGDGRTVLPTQLRRPSHWASR